MKKENTQKKIYVWAFLQQNLGDDMFVQTLVRRYPEHLFYIAGNPAYTGFLECEPNVKLMSRGQFLLYRIAGKTAPRIVRAERRKRMKRADAVVKIGGSVFAEYPGWQKALSEIPNPRFYIVGANFGPFSTQSFFLAKKTFIAQSTDCCFRDRYSFRLFDDVPLVRYAPDILWGYPCYPPKTPGNGVGISILNLSAFRELENRLEEYERSIARICDHYCTQETPVTLFGFCKTQGDSAAIERILSYCKAPRMISAEIYNGDICRFLEILNSVETIYASRFHAMILGFAMQKKVIPIIYSNKQKNVLGDIGYQGVCWNMMENESPDPQVLSCASAPLTESFLQEYQDQAKGQFSGLDQFLLKSD